MGYSEGGFLQVPIAMDVLRSIACPSYDVDKGKSSQGAVAPHLSSAARKDDLVSFPSLPSHPVLSCDCFCFNHQISLTANTKQIATTPSFHAKLHMTRIPLPSPHLSPRFAVPIYPKKLHRSPVRVLPRRSLAQVTAVSPLTT
ncbi:hypothetical protein ACH5RR_037263 [Cinchona calisaya]|uniref:Uncharacterized protein n=1 Tax=Cinchona calisaya TaxID=153742 RepID=A0ABD2Y5M8_9GENT